MPLEHPYLDRHRVLSEQNTKGDSMHRALAIQVVIQRNTFLTEEAEYIAFGK